MKRPLFLVIGLTLTSLAEAQQVRIEYDKLTGVVRYMKCEQKKDRTECHAIDKPKLKQGDVVELKMANINEFVYRAKTTTHIDQDTVSANFGSGFGSFLGSTQSLFGNLNFGAFDISAMQTAMGGMFNMGGAAPSIPDEVERELLPLRAQQRDVDQGLDRILGEVRAVDATLKTVNDLKMSRDKTLAQIRKERDSLLTSLTANVPGVMEEGYALRTERNLEDHLAAARRLNDSQEGLLANLNSDILIAGPRRRREDLDAVAKSFNGTELDQHIASIRTISEDIDKATFEYIETVTIDKERATSLLMNVEIYDQTELAEPTTADGVQPGKVVRYFNDRWVTPQGFLTDTLCDNCAPLKQAEGYYMGSPADPALGTSNNDVWGRSGAYGLWKHWDRNGRLVEEHYIDRPDLAGLVQVTPNSGPVPKLETKKVFRMPVDRGLILSTSVGVSLSSLLESPKEYQVVSDTTFGYSLLLETERSNIIPVVSSFFHFHWDGESDVHVGGNLGIGVALAEQISLSVMGGPSLIFGKKQTLILNMGVNATQVERKLDYLPLDEPFESSLAYNGTTSKQWSMGLFIGVSFGIGSTGQ
ncbi:MAG: hypothetical protein JNL43_02495 [Flavobacteriales bacterium]|nr:hypothetical protein [Flavobacteriales bacterium]